MLSLGISDLSYKTIESTQFSFFYHSLNSHRQISPTAKADKTTAGIKCFDRVYTNWTRVRGVGVPGVLTDVHAYRPEWERELVECGLSPFTPSEVNLPHCFRPECGLDCPLNHPARPILETVMDRYAAAINPWSASFETRLAQVIYHL